MQADRAAYPIAAVINGSDGRDGARRALSETLAAAEPGCFVEMSASMARIRGLATGEWVRVFNERGSVEAPVLVTDRIRPFQCEDNEGHYVQARTAWPRQRDAAARVGRFGPCGGKPRGGGPRRQGFPGRYRKAEGIMADKASSFDSSRCLPGLRRVNVVAQAASASGAASSGGLVARAFAQAAVLDEEAPLAVARFERTLADRAARYRKRPAPAACTAEAPCTEAVSTGALAVGGETGFVTWMRSVVSCHLCAMVCPADAPTIGGERGELCLCGPACAEAGRRGRRSRLCGCLPAGRAGL